MTVAGRTITKADFQSGPGQPEADPEQPVGPTNGRLRTGTMVDRQLLPQRQVLEHETSMSARHDDQEPRNLDDTDDHGPA